jgi:hypothetical protein
MRVSDRIRPFADIPTIKQTVAMAHRTSLTGTFALLCASAAAAQTIPLASTVQSSPPTLPSRDEAKRAVVTCGLPGNRVSVRYEPDMQEDVVWIAHRGKPLSEATLTCVARASLTTGHATVRRSAAPRRCRSTSAGHRRAARPVACSVAAARSRATRSLSDQIISAHADAESDVALVRKPMLAPSAHLSPVGKEHRKAIHRPR